MAPSNRIAVQKVLLHWAGLVGLAFVGSVFLARQQHPYSLPHFIIMALMFALLSLGASYLWSRQRSIRTLIIKAATIFGLTVVIAVIIAAIFFVWAVSDRGFGTMDIAGTIPLAMIAFGSYVFLPPIAFAASLALYLSWPSKHHSIRQASVEASSTSKGGLYSGIAKFLLSLIAPASMKPPVLILYTLLIATYLWFLHKVVFWWTLGSHASCSNGPNGSHEMSIAFQNLQFAMIAAIALVTYRGLFSYNASICRKAGRLLVLCVTSILLTIALSMGGVPVYSWAFQSYLCEIGPKVVHEPSCFHCWCGPCGG